VTQAALKELSELRAWALSEAEAVLRELSFDPAGARAWRGKCQTASRGSVHLRLVLLPTFPDTLPSIYLDPADSRHESRGAGSPPAHPHIERSGKVCIAGASGLLLDTTRPKALILESLHRVVQILDAPAEEQSRDRKNEFLAYWSDEGVGTLWSICPPDGPSTRLAVLRISGAMRQRLLAPTLEMATEWATRAGLAGTPEGDAYHVRLRELFEPPPFTPALSLSRLLDLIAPFTEPADFAAMRAWFADQAGAGLLAMSAPQDEGHVIFAAQCEQPTGEERRTLDRGYRPGHTPAAVVLQRRSRAAVARVPVVRFDKAFLLPRGGADESLGEFTVGLVGCGAIGSHLAYTLAAAGIGSMVLVDPESLDAGNIHRHYLGAGYVGRPKAASLAVELQRHFPSLECTTFDKRFESLLEERLVDLTSLDCLVIAIGDDTVERRLNSVVACTLPRVHVWLEPLDVGGHVLLTGIPNARGCFECLYESDDSGRIHNVASLLDSAQLVDLTLGGCAGSFVPYSVLGAVKVASVAAGLVCNVLMGKVLRPQLTTMASGAQAATNAGMRMSSRGRKLAGSGEVTNHDITRADCLTCATWLA
jgi:ThiF family/Prokaryotic E2 family B